MRSPANRRTRSSSADRKKRDSPGSPWRPARPRSWLSMRRDSWRSVPKMNSPPASTHLLARPARRARSSLGSTLGDALARSRASPGLQARAWRSSSRARCSALPPSLMSTPRPAMLVAIVTAPGLAGLGDRSRASRSACSGLALSTVCGIPRLRQALGQQLGDLDRDRADEHRLAVRRGAPRSRARRPTTCRPWSCRPDRCGRRGPSAGWSGSGRPGACRSS